MGEYKLDGGRGQVVHFLESYWFGDGGEDTCGVPTLDSKTEIDKNLDF